MGPIGGPESTAPGEEPPRRRSYRVFGGRLVSEVELPGLPDAEAGDPADWTLARLAGDPPDEDGTEFLAEDRVTPEARVRLLRAGEELRLAYDDTGVFAVSGDGADIRWWPGPAVEEAAVRLDVVGRVLPLALFRRGVLCLHASAALTGDGALAFLGPAGAGKSTMALTLSELGAGVLSDDAVPVEPGPPARVRPGVSLVRLRSDVARAAGRRAGADTDGEGRVEVDVDHAVGEGATVPLAALYVLQPAETGDDRIRRERLTGREAALALVGEVKLGPLLAPWRGAELLRTCASLERTVPVYRLTVPRDLDRLDDPARFVLEIHGGPVPADTRPPPRR